MKRTATWKNKAVYCAIALVLALTLAGCEPTNGVPQTSSLEITAVPIASSEVLAPTFSPSPVPMPTPEDEPEPVLPKKGSGDDATFDVSCPTPDDPVFPVWSYRTVDSEFEIETLASRLWGDGEYKLTSVKDHSNVIEYATAESGVITIVHDALKKITLSFQNNVAKPAEGDFSLDDAWLRGEDFMNGFLGDMDYPAKRIGPFNNASIPVYSLIWMRTVNGYRVTGEFLSTDISRADGEITAFYGDWHTLEAEMVNPPVKPITFAQALYVLEYYRSCALSNEPDVYRDLGLTSYSIFAENDRVDSVEIVYTDAFHQETAVFSPAWAIQIHGDNSQDKYPSDVLVDMETGELYIEGVSRWPSPYPARGRTPSGAKLFEQWDK